jgi:translation initiation factor 2B subunit (eIF-2B alpha/beta/delta family)
MNEKDREHLYKLFRDQADVLGSSRLTVVALQSFVASVKALRCSREEIMPLFKELADAIKNSQPHIVPLIHLIEEFEAEIEPFTEQGLEAIRTEALRILEAKIAKIEESKRRVVEQGLRQVESGDVILVHAVSTVVLKILVRAHEELGRRFEVIVLEQDFNKTRQLLQALDRVSIPHEVIPEYTLSHAIRRATKLFLGATAVTPDGHIVTPAGTANIVSLCHVEKIPVYLFVSTLKFSHKPSEAQQIHRKEEHRSREGLCYDLTTYSHCLVPIALIDHVITEDGEAKHSLPF